jgi:hypothetical protein
VPDTKRQHAITQVALEEARVLKGNPTMIWITTQERITPDAVLSAPWVVVGRETPMMFQGLAEPIKKENAGVFARNGGQLG